MRRKSSSSVKVKYFKIDYNKVLSRLKQYSHKIINKGVRLVVLIGSLARGDYTGFSDADIIIIYDKAPSNPLERIELFIDPTLPVDLDIRVYTTEELIRMAREKRRVVEEIIKYGIVLAGEDSLIDKVREIFESS